MPHLCGFFGGALQIQKVAVYHPVKGMGINCLWMSKEAFHLAFLEAGWRVICFSQSWGSVIYRFCPHFGPF